MKSFPDQAQSSELNQVVGPQQPAYTNPVITTDPDCPVCQAMAAPTPTPWIADGEMIYASIGEHTYAKRVADCAVNEYEDDPQQAFGEHEAEDNARLIVRAVNSHEALVKALDFAAGCLEDHAIEGNADSEALIEARAALALAKGV